jgi:hypothetical protein
MWRALPKPDAALGLAGLPRRTTSAGPLVGGFVLYFTASYTLTFLLVGGLGMLALLAVTLIPDVDRPAPEAKGFGTRAAELRLGLAEVFRTPPIFVAGSIEPVMYIGYGAFRLLQLIKDNPSGLVRGEILERKGLKGDKAGEMSVLNALTALTKANQVTRRDGRYIAAA